MRALSEVTLSLRAGEVLGLVGDNGAGKSTLVRCIGGIHRLDSGEISIDGVTHKLRTNSAIGSANLHIFFLAFHGGRVGNENLVEKLTVFAARFDSRKQRIQGIGDVAA